MITKKQIYSDIPFFITPNPFTGDFNLVKDLGAIRQSLKNIILSNQGERPFDFLFGASLYKNLFENLTPELILSTQSRIATNVKRYDSRVDITEIRLFKSETVDYTIDVYIFYEIPDLGIKDTLTIAVTRDR